MARNKYPEETVNKILDIAFRLFREKGYDHTTIQDITNALGMSKGAVYHHFKSKEDILDHISDRYYNNNGWFEEIRFHPSLNGLQKLQQLLIQLLSDPNKLDLDQITVPLVADPKLIDLTLRSTIKDASPFIGDLVREGVLDGSITVRQPKEFTEAFMLLVNIWVGIFTSSKEDFMSKLSFLKEFTEKLGAPIINEEFLMVCSHYFDQILILQQAGN